MVFETEASLKEDVRRLLAGEPHPSHQWNRSILNQCVQCGEFATSRTASVACEPSKIAGRIEFCCECGESYPVQDHIAGHVFCSKCRKETK